MKGFCQFCALISKEKGQLLRLRLHKNYSKLQMPYTESEVTHVRIDICLSVKGIYTFGSLLCSRAQAIAIGQALVDGRWLDCVTHHDQLFRDEYVLYRPLQVRLVWSPEIWSVFFFMHSECERRHSKFPKELHNHTLVMTCFFFFF